MLVAELARVFLDLDSRGDIKYGCVCGMFSEPFEGKAFLGLQYLRVALIGILSVIAGKLNQLLFGEGSESTSESGAQC